MRPTAHHHALVPRRVTAIRYRPFFLYRSILPISSGIATTAVARRWISRAPLVPAVLPFRKQPRLPSPPAWRPHLRDQVREPSGQMPRPCRAPPNSVHPSRCSGRRPQDNSWLRNRLDIVRPRRAGVAPLSPTPPLLRQLPLRENVALTAACASNSPARAFS
jgi:hypothetical protein